MKKKTYTCLKVLRPTAVKECKEKQTISILGKLLKFQLQVCIYMVSE